MCKRFMNKLIQSEYHQDRYLRIILKFVLDRMRVKEKKLSMISS
jgi:hypothetical protein